MSRTMPMPMQASYHPSWNWGPALMPFIGVALILFKTLVIICGLQLLRYANVLEEKEQEQNRQRRDYLKYRLLGLSMAMAIGPLAEVSAYAFAPQSLLAPLDGFDVIWNILLAPYTLGESITRAKVVGTGLVFAGAATAPMFGPHHKPPETIVSLRLKFLSTNFLGWVVVCFIFAMIAALSLQRGVHSPAKRGLILAMSGGFVAGQRFFLSSTATVLHTSFDEGNWDLWKSPLPYFIVGGMFFVAIGNAVLLNRGLKEFEAMFIIPTFVGTSIITTSVSAAVILKETAWLEWWRLIGYWCGILLVVTGMVIIAKDASLQHNGCREPASDRARQLQASIRPLNSNGSGGSINVVSCVNSMDMGTRD